MKEIWKEIFDGECAVSNFGRVKRIKGGKWKKAGRIFKTYLEKPKRNKSKYEKVTISINKKIYTRWVHRLVCEAFYGIRPEGCWVNHKDGNKANNKLENLEYVTYSENARHSLRNGLSKRKLSFLAIGRIKELYRLGVTPKELGLIFGIGADHASNVAKEKSWGFLQTSNPFSRANSKLNTSKIFGSSNI